MQLLDLWPTIRVWRSVHFIPLFLMSAVLLTNLTNPPRKRSHSSSRLADAAGNNPSVPSATPLRTATSPEQNGLKAE